jgi:signal transduction histidine kinase
MGLWEAAGMPPPFKGKEHDSGGRFMPVQALIDSARVSFSANHLVRIASQKTSTDDTKQSLWIVFTELLNNCYDHAQKNLGLYGLACAQSWPKANWAQVAIIDSGEGIRETLMGNPGLHSRLREDNACSIATEYGTTGKPLGHSGYGLNLARRLMELNGGNIIVISDHEAFSSSKGQVVVESIGTRWRGTIVVLEWPIRAKLDVGAVYAEWPPIDG